VPGSYPGVKQLGRDAEHCLPSSAEVKNECTLLPLHDFMVWTGVTALTPQFPILCTAFPLYYFLSLDIATHPTPCS
jgi:hypothetical protein